ncbi:histidine phosphatase family protein [Hoyosella rhizosphaerae]|uniref:Phosphohistidine phosphatase n=1 Tax=Hoyosella rhizosphaerae TaxID=1755582 RepID=A0A916XJ34_9ACTN|nr:histidine phosphatase family protein [Hoyosella rhizosphaerae]MBN4927811.1 histidine phosphatase family protein [Hoyosella rhizosphaerae]GGC76929.1 phosphohistidine phosphatase [Hoyosella rhizosphaerae]
MDNGRKLIFMRHGKSAYPLGVADHDRPLADRGQREAGLAGDWLRTNVGSIDLTLCSTATRTRDTLAATKLDGPVSFIPEFYGADIDTIIEELRLVENDVTSLLVIAHWPGIPDTTLWLAENDTGEAAQHIRTKYPTSALAVLSTDQPWDRLNNGSCHLDTFHVPR